MNHKYIRKPAAIIILAMVVILASSVQASARVERVEVFGSTCTQTQSLPERFWISEDGIVHMRDVVLQNIDITDSPYDTGNATMTMNVDMNPVTGEGHGYGTFTLYPTAYNGTWVGHWSTHISPDGLRGSAVGHGTGELEGMQIFNNISNTDPNNPCTISDITVLIP